MANLAQGHHKYVSSEKRERDVFLLYGAAFRDIPHLDELGPDSETCSLPSHHVPQQSQDSTLSALAQLATLRLGAGRAMISLIDGQRQFILAEATPNISIHPETPGDTPSSLWLGSVSIPRTWASMRKKFQHHIVTYLTLDRYVKFFPLLLLTSRNYFMFALCEHGCATCPLVQCLFFMVTY
jgi:hypothetical protein